MGTLLRHRCEPEKPQMVLQYADHWEQRDTIMGDHLNTKGSEKAQESRKMQLPDQLSREGGLERTPSLWFHPLWFLVRTLTDWHRWLTVQEWSSGGGGGKGRCWTHQLVQHVQSIQMGQPGYKTGFISPASLHVSPTMK